MRILTLVTLTLLWLTTGSAQAADGDSCTATGNVPGTEQSGLCQATSNPSYGTACASGQYYDGASCLALPTQTYAACSLNGASSSTHFFNGSQCVADDSSSDTCAAPSVWDKGQCVTPVADVTPPTAPTGGLGSAAGSLPSVHSPSGNQQPICINSSPTVGMIVGSTICYGTAADTSDTAIYAYHTTQSNQVGNTIISTNTWNGLRLRDLYADGNITSRGLLSSYGGAILLSPDGNTGVVIANGQVITESKSGANTGKVVVTPTAVSSSVTNGISTSSQVLSAEAIQSQVQNATGLSKVLSNATSTLIQTQSGLSSTPTAYSLIQSEVHQVTQRAVDGAKSVQSTVGVDSFRVAATNTTHSSQLNLSSSTFDLINGKVGNPNAYSSIQSNGERITQRAVNGTKSVQSTMGVDDYQLAATSSTHNSQLNLSSSSINLLSGLAGNAGAYSSILSQSNLITQRTADGARYAQNTIGVDNYQISASNGGMQSQVNVTSSSIGLISGAGGTMASNGTSGITSGVGSGAIQVHQSARTIAHNTTINNALAGRTYQNQVNGNLFVDGNVYVNGTLEYVSSNAAVTTVASTAGTSILGAGLTTSGSTSTVMRGTDAPHATVNGNGQISVVPGVSAQSASALTLTNGLGNTHGFIVNETQATMSGGINSSSLTLNDEGATFSNSATGQPVQVHGVADGTADYDAVNVRQLEKVNRQLSAGVAGAVASVNIPQVDPGKNFALGVGVGNFQGASALAIGSSVRVNPNTVIKATLSGVDSGSSRTTTVGMGIGMSW
jgi:hypothetical protein